MPEIRMKSISAGPGGVFHPGARRVLPDHEAAALVKGGFAEYTTIVPEEKAVVALKETATIVPEETETVEPEKVYGREHVEPPRPWPKPAKNKVKK